jgi:aquaporin Z
VDQRDLTKQLIVEFIGPFTLCFAGIGAIIATQGADLVAIALAHGLAIGLMITAVGHVSGGHFNPAVTLGFLAARRIEPLQAGLYIVSQLLGGFAGALVARLSFPEEAVEVVNGGIPALGTVVDIQVNAGQALLMEIVLTFFLVFVIFGAAVDGRTGRWVVGLAIGLVISMDILAGAAVSGAAMNPARSLGPQILEGDLAHFWIWIVGPIVGAVAAALLYNGVLFPGAAGDSSRAPEPAPQLE